MQKYLLSIGLFLISLNCSGNFNEGVAAYDKGDYQTALKEWKEVAEQKSFISQDFEWHSNNSIHIAEAQYALGLLYWQGKGVEQNYNEAKKWLMLAANRGNSEAQLKLAYLFLTGLDGSVNFMEAVKWFERSAKQGNVNAQYNLGLLYYQRAGGGQNMMLAKKWLTSAALQGDSSAKELLAKINATIVPQLALVKKQPNATDVSRVIMKDQPIGSINIPQPVVVSPVIQNKQSESRFPQQKNDSADMASSVIVKEQPSEIINVSQAVDKQTATSKQSESTPSLLGSTWHYVDAQWQYDLEFATNGVLHTTHPQDKSKDNDRWEQDGDVVNFYFNNKFSHFSGKLSGDNQMSGTAINKKGSTWTWKASLAE